MPDILDHPKFTAVLHGSGNTNADVVMIKELARHAVLEAFSAALRVINSAPEKLQPFVTLGATAVIEMECRKHLDALENDLDKRMNRHEG